MFLSALKQIFSKPTILSKKNHYYKLFCTSTTCCDPKTEVKKGIVLGVHTGENDEIILTPSTNKINDQLAGKLKDLCDQSSKPIGSGSSRVFNNISDEFWSIAVVGLGPQNPGLNKAESIDENKENVRVAAAIGTKKLAKQGCNSICIDGMGYPEAAAEGSLLSIWRYQDNKSKANLRIVPEINMYDDPTSQDWHRGVIKAEAQNFVRKLSDIPSNQLSPVEMAKYAIEELCPCGITILIHDADWIEQKKMTSFLTVAKGSCVPPLFMEITYCGLPVDEKPILLVGKGITFDSGGMCLKSKGHMGRHRADMSGAATIISAIKAAAMFQLPVNLTGVIPFCENLPSGMAMKVGDVIRTTGNGKTVKIEDTDNEGRLCIIDAIMYGMATYKPKLLIDVSTESKGVTAALGSSASGVFTNSHSLWQEVQKAGMVTGDRVWRLPLWKYYSNNVTKCPSVDVLNKGIGKGDVCLAAAFIGEFIACIDWIHFDVNGVGMKSHDKVYPYLKRGRMTGRPVRTLIQLLYQLSCPGPHATK